jgi:hypothetical protein
MTLLTVAGATTTATLLRIAIAAAVTPTRPPSRNQSTPDPGALERITRARLYSKQTDNVTTSNKAQIGRRRARRCALNAVPSIPRTIR